MVAQESHGRQSGPHALASLSFLQTAPQRWYPALQTKSHAVPLHMAVAPAGGTQGVHAVVPQELTLLLLAQVLPHLW